MAPPSTRELRRIGQIVWQGSSSTSGRNLCCCLGCYFSCLLVGLNCVPRCLTPLLCFPRRIAHCLSCLCIIMSCLPRAYSALFFIRSVFLCSVLSRFCVLLLLFFFFFFLVFVFVSRTFGMSVATLFSLATTYFRSLSQPNLGLSTHEEERCCVPWFSTTFFFSTCIRYFYFIFFHPPADGEK